MLQSGGSTNVSSALLKEVFKKERKAEDKMNKVVLKKRSQTQHGSRRGTYKSTLVHPNSPRMNTFDLPNHGIGYGVELPPVMQTTPDDINSPTRHTNQTPRTPGHGRLPPYNRRDLRRGMYDTVSGGICCLNPPSISYRNSENASLQK
eukprot:PhF_6_TR11661/c2_g1_i1/m.18826